MIRLAIDQDADGSYVLITRPCAPAERVELTHCDAIRLMSKAAQVEEGKRCAQSGIRYSLADPAKPHVVVDDVRFPHKVEATRVLGV